MSLEKKLRIEPGTKVNLSDYDPADTHGIKDHAEADELIREAEKTMTDLQYRLYAENKQSLLIVLQALDAGGKDGVINRVFASLNPQGCRVQPFKVPTAEESAHDFLWRVHKVAPRQGEVVIFNRSHYESVLVSRVHSLDPENVIEERYGLINDFERLLASGNTKIVKFFLHISPEEQLARFLERLDDPAKNWKISASDYSEREHWGEYMKAFEHALGRCSTEDAPWYVIPSNKKWFRNYTVSKIIAETMEAMAPKTPSPSVDLDEIRKLAAAASGKAK